MTVFKAFLKVIKKNLGTILIYTSIVIIFSAVNTQAGNQSGQFVSEKPDIMIINEDKGSAVSENFEKYLQDNANFVDIGTDENDIADALFYRDISCIVTIPKGYGKSVLEKSPMQPEISSTGSYEASLTKNMIQRYLRVQNTYMRTKITEDVLISSINEALKNDTKVVLTTKLDTNSLIKSANYFNFAAYSMMACILFIICVVLSSFNEISVRKRTIVSSMNYKKFGFNLFLASLAYAIVVWLFFIGLSFVMVGDTVLTLRGAAFVINSLIFSITALSLAFMLSTLIEEKNALSAVVNVITLGLSFLCGVFVSTNYLPDWVVALAHIFPTYWYVDTNVKIATTENLRASAMLLVTNSLILVAFAVVFVMTGIIVSGKKRKIT